MIGLPLTVATTSGPCSRLQPDTPAAITTRPKKEKKLREPFTEAFQTGRLFSLLPTHRSCKSFLLGNGMTRLTSGWRFRWICRRLGGARGRRLHALGLQSAIDRCPNLLNRQGA